MKRTPEEKELERVSGSREFSRARQLRVLLMWLCERKLEGDTTALSEYAIGVGPLGRKEDFDPRIDAIVRKEVARLREKLAEYYQRNGTEDGLRIVIEKGSYEPRFEQERSRSSLAPAKHRILVMPFREKGHLTSHLAEEVIELLVEKENFLVAPQVLAEHCRQPGVYPMEPLRKAGVEWLVEGTVGGEGTEVFVRVQLISVNSGFAVASWRFGCQDAAVQVAAALEERLDGLA